MERKEMYQNGVIIELNSSMPGLKDLPTKNTPVRTAYGFIEGRRKIDGAEGLWRIRNNLYDLETFALIHPGGEEWLRLTKGTDITELFESHHLTPKASMILPKYFVREAASPRSVPLTFEPNGFYNTFKKRAREALKDVDFHGPSAKSNMMADCFVASTLSLCIAGAYSQNYFVSILAGIFLSWTTIIGHNYIHMRDSFRMYYFDFCTMSSKDWRITHVMSHHTYPNTIWDFEMYSAEPFFNWLPHKDKASLQSCASVLFSPFLYSLVFFEQAAKRYHALYAEYHSFEFRDVVPFVIPVLMMSFAPSIVEAVKMWLFIMVTASFIFSFTGLNAAHHHPDIFHDGDTFRDNLDWGLLELDAVRERKVVDDFDFLVLTNFGKHGLHHLLPTVDHTYLHLCEDAFNQTCKEFGLSIKKMSQWELIKGQFRQLLRKEPKKNYR